MAMKPWVKWSAIGSAVVAVAAGIGTASGGVAATYEAVKPLFNLVDKDYVDGKIGDLTKEQEAKLIKLAGDLEPMAKKIDAIAGVIAQQAVRNLQGDLRSVNERIIQNQTMQKSFPAEPRFKIEELDLQQEKAATADALLKAQCAQSQVNFTFFDLNCKK